MAKTLFDIKNDLLTIGAAYAAAKQEKLVEASKPDAKIDTIVAMETKEKELKQRFEILQREHDEMEAEQVRNLQKQPSAISVDPKNVVNSAKAGLIRSVMAGKGVSPEIKAALGDKNSTGGDKILPSTMTTELLHEPFVKNPLRDVATVTSITNLEIPKIGFTLDTNDDFIADTATAKELKADGDVVTFGRFKFKVFVPVSETILSATDTNLVQTVEQALRSGLAAKEKKVAFATTPATGEELLSFYSTQNNITQVDGPDLFEAITNSIAALHEDYRENASILMKYSDYLTIIKTLANGSATLYNAPPEQVLGKPVVFSDSAAKPIVGDFRYSHINYDPQVLYDRDKDVKTGVELFVLTAWLDHKIKLKSAFRIANVVVAP